MGSATSLWLRAGLYTLSVRPPAAYQRAVSTAPKADEMVKLREYRGKGGV